MLLARKLRSAVQVFRRQGWDGFADLARVRTVALYRTYRTLPQSPAARARALAATLNRFSQVSALAIDDRDLVAARPALLLLYLRHRFAEVVIAAEGLDRLHPVEIAMVADSLLTLWDFHKLDAVLPDWIEAVAGTKFALRIAQTVRRTALRLGRLTQAAEPIAGDCEDVGSLVLRGDVYDALDRTQAAADAYEAAVRRDGCDADARRARAFHLLKAGHTLDGLAEWSVADTLSGDYPLRRHRPRWAGEPLGRRRLMVLFEHGLGDMIQMARFLPRLQAREPDTLVSGRVPAPLAGLFRRAFPGVTFFTEDEREPDYDLFVPSMHLAAVLDAASLEPRSHYIDLGPRRPGAGGRPRIGVCWRGHPRQYEVTRSVALDRFATLFAEEGMEFVVLLNRLTPEEAALLDDVHPEVEVPPIRDFVDLATVVASCDLVVSVDTAVVHLAAAGGVPVVLLSRPDGCWRWGVPGRSSPWYDGVDVLRHGGDMDWPSLLEAARQRIRAFSHVPALAGVGP